MTALVEHGRATGAFRADLDARLVAFGMIGMCNWVAAWFDPGGSMTPDEIARQYVTLLTESLLA